VLRKLGLGSVAEEKVARRAVWMRKLKEAETKKGASERSQLRLE
jgi:hypothetical protein